MNVALLDYDNTLSDGYSRYKLGFEMEEADVLKKGLKEEIEDLEGRYLSGEIDYNEKFAEDKLIFSKYHEGIKRLDAVRFLENEIDMEESLYPWAKELILNLKEAGFLVVVISGAWDFIMEQAQDILDFDAFFATEIAVDKDLFTSDYKIIMDASAKKSVTKKVLLESSKSIGLGDSIADFSFLELVDKPFLYMPKDDALKAAKGKNFVITNESNVVDKVDEAIKELTK